MIRKQNQKKFFEFKSKIVKMKNDLMNFHVKKIWNNVENFSNIQGVHWPGLYFLQIFPILDAIARH